MPAIGYNPIGPGEFTKQMLDANFTQISKYSKDVDQILTQLAGQVDVLAKRPNEVIVQLPKSRKMLVFAVGVTAGVYIYKHRRQIEVFFDNVNESARQRFTQPKKDANWTTQSPSEKDNPEQDSDSYTIH